MSESLIQRIANSRHYPEEGQLWGYLISEALHEDLQDAAKAIGELPDHKPVSLIKFAISLSIWSHGQKSNKDPMIAWGNAGQAMRHAYIDQAKGALDAAGIPYVE